MNKNDDYYVLKKENPKVKEIISTIFGILLARVTREDVEVIIRKYKKVRSDLQNRYLHGWIFRNQMMKKLNDAGMTTEDGSEYDVEILKIIFKQPYFADQIEEPRYFTIDGVEHRHEFHPSELPTDKFTKYCELICWASSVQWEVVVEEPVSGQWLAIYEELKGYRK